ncbi:MAG: AMP-binding protein [Actinobacteria bacterium]|nr:AMP-binding protein [Actinomycetota bacterium]
MSGWNFAELWEAIADRFPDAQAQVQGDRRFTWREFDQRSDALARHLIDGGATHQDKVALYLQNCPEYMEGCYAAFKGALVPVNTNYRYLDDELVYLWDNADAIAVVFHGSFVDRVDAVRARLPKVRHWIWVDDGTAGRPEWAEDYEAVVSTPPGRTVPPWGRSGDDVVMIYTGGTTGMPKGVMWRQDDLIAVTCGNGNAKFAKHPDEVGGVEGIVGDLTQPGPPGLPACPLMHGTGWFTANIFLTQAGSVVTLVDRTLDWVEVLDTIEREHVGALTIVGDAFGKPMVRTLDANPDRWDLSSLVLVASSGVMWSEPVKQAMLAHNPGMLLVDTFSSSEAIGMGNSVSYGGSAEKTAHFALGAGCKVFADDGRPVAPGSGERGRVAVPGRVPIAYYKDPEKSASTFIEFEGVRYSMPGDYATVEADGTITLLGRGSVCINTGGEKVFPEEVEEALKTHDAVADAVVVGVPDEKFGEAITAVVEPAPGASLDEAALIAHVKEHLAHYKAPKRVLGIDTIGRAPNGKVDYKRMTAYAVDALGLSPA